jgi:hypothetical protein
MFPGTRFNALGLNDIGGVGNEAEVEMFIDNQALKNEDDNDDSNQMKSDVVIESETEKRKKEKNESVKIEDDSIVTENNEKSYLNKKEKDEYKHYYCSYVLLRGTVPLKWKIRLESVLDKPKILMFFVYFSFLS